MYKRHATSFDEGEYMFKNDVVFSQKILGGANSGLVLNGKDIMSIVGGIIKGILSGKIKVSTVKRILKGLNQSTKIGKLYDNYPATPAELPAWKAKADALWQEIGSAIDTCDPAIIEKVSKK
ncbi:MAG: hypothetical protein K2M36_02070 [Clostridia bacterium]|nr:hypothetical protein [Clostridia bacterium]